MAEIIDLPTAKISRAFLCFPERRILKFSLDTGLNVRISTAKDSLYPCSINVKKDLRTRPVKYGDTSINVYLPQWPDEWAEFLHLFEFGGRRFISTTMWIVDIEKEIAIGAKDSEFKLNLTELGFIIDVVERFDEYWRAHLGSGCIDFDCAM